MKKRITIINNNNKIVMLDDDSTPLSEYSENLSKIMSNENISLLEVSTGILITRPSQINSILIEEIKSKESEDVIKDA